MSSLTVAVPAVTGTKNAFDTLPWFAAHFEPDSAKGEFISIYARK